MDPWGHVSNFHILDLEDFVTTSLWCIGVIKKLVDSQLVDYTYDGRTHRELNAYKFIIVLRWSTVTR